VLSGKGGQNMKRPQPRKWLSNKTQFVLHGWLGMNFGLLLLWVCLSGVIASLSFEIEWLTQPELRIEAEGPVRWQATYEALRKAYPDHQIGGFARHEPVVMASMAWSSYIIKPDGDFAQVHVDPYAGEVVRAPTRLYLQDVVRQLHYVFLGGGSWGFYLVCFVAFPLLLSIVSALLFFKRWWRHLFRLRFGSGSRAFFSSLHRVTGVWSLIFGLVIAITGVWYLVEDFLPADAFPQYPTVSEERLAAVGPTPPALPLERYIEAARESFPGLEPSGIYLPTGPDDVVQVRGRSGRILVRDRANAVFLDPYDASVVGIHDSSRDGALKWWMNAADSLHFGYWGGLASKILWAVFGLCLPVMVLTGAYLSWRRAGIVGPGNPFRNRLARDELPWWRRRPLRTWIMLGVAGLIIAWAMDGYERRAEAPAPFIEIGEVDIGPWQARLSREPAAGVNAPMRYAVAFDAGPEKMVNLRRAALVYVDENRDRIQQAGHDAVELRGATHLMRATLPIPADLRGDTLLQLRAKTWNGERFHATLRDTHPVRTPDDDRHYQPAAPRVFFAIIVGYATVSLLIAGAWFVLDTVPRVRGRAESRSARIPPLNAISLRSGVSVLHADHDTQPVNLDRRWPRKGSSPLSE